MSSRAEMGRYTRKGLAAALVAFAAAFPLRGATAEGAMDATPAQAVHPANDPMTCKPLWQAVGLPVTEGDPAASIVPVCHIGYIAGHNSANKTPDWVVALVTRDGASGAFPRPDKPFRVETALPDGAPRAVSADYTNSGLDRGHQAASGDFSGDEKVMIDTFFYSNAVPQQGIGFNQHIWALLEMEVQQLARARGELVVITGPINLQNAGVDIPAAADACGRAVQLPLPKKLRICDANDKNPAAPCPDGVTVPAALYKIVYDPAMMRVNAYLMENTSHLSRLSSSKARAYLESQRVSVGTVEALTGLRFFSAIDERMQRILRETCPDTMHH